jgi:hypothetical protein
LAGSEHGITQPRPHDLRWVVRRAAGLKASTERVQHIVIRPAGDGSLAVKERIEHLIAQTSELSGGTDTHRQRVWLTAAQNAVELVCPSTTNPYHIRAREIVHMAMHPTMSSSMSGMAALLTRLLEEIEGGLLTTIENHAIAVTFDDFLDHGAEYLKHDRKDEATVIAGIVFEDTIRRICRVLESPRTASRWTR